MMPPLYVAAQQGRGLHRALAEARGESIDDRPQAVAAYRDGIQERKLSLVARSKTRGRESDEPNRLAHGFPVQHRESPPIELESVARGIAGGAARPRAE